MPHHTEGATGTQGLLHRLGGMLEKGLRVILHHTAGNKAERVQAY